MKRLSVVALLGVLVLSGCVVGPNYKRPLMSTPTSFRGADQGAIPQSLADTKWPDLFQDPALTALVTNALTQNYDMRIAAERILQARAQYGITRSDAFPTVEVAGAFSANRNSRVGAIPFLPPEVNTDVSYSQLGFRLGWELDVWGRVRRLKESELAQYLATEEAQRAVTTTVIADTTAAYLTLREFDLELEIATKTRVAAEDGLRLNRLRQQQGVATSLDVNQAEQLLRAATAQIAASERAIAQAENALSLLTGLPPAAVARGKKLEDLVTPAQVPVGLPSSLLERRPDIRAAEQALISANAQIGVARAAYFPQISLTAFMGGQSRALTDLFSGAARQWNFNPVANLPIFNAGRIRNGVRLTEALQREALVRYERSIQTAFREVADSLVGFQKTGEQHQQQQLLVGALRESNRLSTVRYQGGLDSYLQVLDAERNLFESELIEARLRRDVLLSFVQLYRALGGGWQ
jgi:NodT family efflux transporter outer membrane factor (OMF) lipoprotein